MKPSKPVVLIVDDPFRALAALPHRISEEICTPVWVPGTKQGLKVLSETKDQVRVIIVDIKADGLGGGGFVHLARKINPEAHILMTGPLGTFLYREGRFYTFSGTSLAQSIDPILKSLLVSPEATALWSDHINPRLPKRDSFGDLIGSSQIMNDIYRLIENLRPSLATVLIQGESGTGKELAARAIHQTSPRSKGAFVAVNCGAIPDNLVESELFGHERGAFTTAVRQRKGKFELARGGTIFLDEIGDLDRPLQVKLLRVLQEREFQRVGGDANIKTDVRVIAATSRDLRESIQSGTFREDLFYRLNVVPIQMPPLRDRAEDIPSLLDHFFGKKSRGQGRSVPRMAHDAMEVLARYSYPGNVRELSNIVERLCVCQDSGPIGAGDLPPEVLEETGFKPKATNLIANLPENGVYLEDLEKELILKTLKKTSGNKMAAAKMLGMTRRRLYLRLAHYGFK